MIEVVIVSGVRTAIGNYGGALQDIPVVKMGSIVIKQVLKRVGLRPKRDPEVLSHAPEVFKDTGLIDLERKYYDWDDSLKEVRVDEVIMGNVLQAGQGQNTGRQASIYAGIPKEVTAYTVNKICALVIMSAEKAKELGLKPMVTIKSYASGGVDPAFMGLGAVPATKKALKLAGLSLKDIDLIELNEAFASQSIGVIRELGLNLDKVNPHGGGISVGHPIGCTGARIIVSLIYEMMRHDRSFGLATLCIGGGQGMAIVIERK